MGTLALTDGGHFRLLAHTADIGLEATAPSREELFVVAARGLTFLLFGKSPAIASICRTVTLDAGDSAELLVTWLNEILVFSETAQVVPAAFLISDLQNCRLTATLAGEPFDPSRHVVERTAKAVTYHQLVVEERHSEWYARVYIDL
ncbi:MAG: archease [Desulfuromonadales bacterium]|nr:archease [Desulfuromonadales bacterium]